VPKMKTHKGTAKRVRLTGTGKAMMRTFSPKRAKRRRSKMYDNRGNVPVHESVMPAIRKNLPYGTE
jgi:ribosomal protein L35